MSRSRGGTGRFLPRMAAMRVRRLRFRTIRRETAIHPIDTTMRRTQATDSTGSRRNSPNLGPSAASSMSANRIGLSEDSVMEPEVADKRAALEVVLEGLAGAVVAYSGGVDSSVLAAIAHDVLGDRCVAATAVSPSMASREVEAAVELAHTRGWDHVIFHTSEVDREEYARNDPDRCYWCKVDLYETLGPLARQRGASILVGTNRDDLVDIRPGHRAARERGVLSPLSDVGLTKAQVRDLARAMDLPVADKPASPCLASRFAYGVRVTAEGLRRVEAAEELLRSLGFEVLRVRDHGDLARVEVPAESIESAAAQRDAITQGLRELGYVYVTLDLAGFRSGSQNEVLSPPRFRP